MTSTGQPQMSNAVIELIHAVGDLALWEGEEWRLDHPALMDAYNACCEEYLPERKVENPA
jgi:hypothetical protein